MIQQTNLITGLYTLEYCVLSVLADLELPRSKQYVRFLKFGVDAFRRLNLAGQMPTVKTAVLDIDPFTHTAILPNDYISTLKLGVCCHGHFINFDIDDSLCIKPPNSIVPCACSDTEIAQQIDDMCCGKAPYNYDGNQVLNSGSGVCQTGNAQQGNIYNTDWAYSWYYPFYSRWHNGQYTAGFYGMGAGFHRGGYKINTEASIIQFSTCLHLDQVVLEYVSTGIDESGNAIIPQNAIEAICAFIHERNCATSKVLADKQMVGYWNKKWTNAATTMTKRNEAMSYLEWVELFRRYTYQIPKR